MQIDGNITAKVEVYKVAPRKAGVKVREYVAKLKEDGKDFNFSDMENVDKIIKEDPAKLVIMEKIGFIITSSLIKSIKDENNNDIDQEEFFDLISDNDYKKLAEATGEVYQKSMKDIEKKTEKKPIK